MPLKTAVMRAARAMREDGRLYLVAVASLTVAFLSLATALLAISNVSSVAEAWTSSARMSLYLRDGVPVDDVERLQLVLETLPEVSSVDYVTPSEARREFLQTALHDDEALAQLPADVFPASLEVELAAGAGTRTATDLAARVGRFGAVEEVETYDEYFDSLATLVNAGRVASALLATLVVLCVLFVVASTIRLAIAGRRQEIEVLKLCGASDGFVRGPFLVEGAVQGLVSALLSVVLLLAIFLALREPMDATLSTLAGIRTAFLHPAVAVALVIGGTAIGAAGSALSLRRYLTV
ncbi:MAG: cell division protein FtsX [Sandaracinaceae bacterium]